MTEPVGGAGELTALSEGEIRTIIYDALKNQFPAEGAAIMVAGCCAKPVLDALNKALAAKAPQGVDSQIICRKLDAVAQHLNLKGRPQSLDIATAVRLVEEGAEWAAKHIEERGRELDKLRATLNKVAKDIDGTSPNGESIARERIQSVLREAAAPKPAPPHPLSEMKPANRSLAEKAKDEMSEFEKGFPYDAADSSFELGKAAKNMHDLQKVAEAIGLAATPVPGAERLRETLRLRAEELHVDQNGSGLPLKGYSDCHRHIFETCTSPKCVEVREALAAAPPAPTIRCRDCGGTVMWEQTAEGYEVIHACKDGNQVREMFAALAGDRHASAERVRDALNEIIHIAGPHSQIATIALRALPPSTGEKSQ